MNRTAEGFLGAFIALIIALMVLVTGCGKNPVAEVEEHGKAKSCEYNEQGELLRCEHTWDAWGEGS